MNNFHAALLAILITPLLSSCWMGDKIREEVSCPKATANGDVIIDLSQPYCDIYQGKLSDMPTSRGYLTIPKQYAPTCSTSFPVPQGSPITEVSLVVSYPDFKPARPAFDGHLKDGQISIRIRTVCEPEQVRSPTKTFEDFASSVAQRQNDQDDNGQKHFAPITPLNDGWYLQKNIRAPYPNYSASYYFHKNTDNEIDQLVGFDDSGMRYARNRIQINSRYMANYLFRSIPYSSFLDLHQKTNLFIENLYHVTPEQEDSKP